MNLGKINQKRLAALVLTGAMISTNCSFFERNNASFSNSFFSEAIAEESKQEGHIFVTDNVNIRKGPSKDSELYGTVLPKGLLIEIYGHTDGWYKIKIDDEYCYVSDQYAVASNAYPLNDQVVVSTTDSLNVRALPSSDNRISPILGRINKDDSLRALYELGDWYAVSYKNKDGELVTGFLSKDYGYYDTNPTIMESLGPLDKEIIGEGIVVENHTQLCQRPELDTIYGELNKGDIVNIYALGQEYALISHKSIEEFGRVSINYAYVRRSNLSITKVNDIGIKK